MQQTSLWAYTEVMDDYGALNRSYGAIIKAYKGSYGLTDLELARKLGYSDPNKVRPRRRELVKKGLVEEKGHRKCKMSNKLVIFWDLRKKEKKDTNYII